MEIVKITPVSTLLAKMNNAEYARFMSVVQSLIKKAAAESLGIEAVDFEDFERNVQVMSDLVVQSRVAPETEKLAALDTQRDALLTFIFNTVRTAVNFPVAEQCDAAISIGLVVAPYVGIQRHPLRQETREIDALLVDVYKPENKNHIVALALDAAFDSLANINEQFRKLDADESKNQINNTLEEARSFRRDISQQYDHIITVAFANSIVHPSDATRSFIEELNKHIEETRTLYNQRIAQTNKNETPAQT